MTDADIEVEAAPPATDAQLKSISALAVRRAELEADVAAAEATLKHRKEALRACEEVDLPAAMLAVGMAEFRLTDGARLVLKTATFGSLTEENRPRGFAYLKDHDAGDLIKHDIAISLQRDQGQYVETILAFLAHLPIGNNVKVSSKEGVHAGTLQAWITRQVAAGAQLPTDIFSLFVRRWVEVKTPRKRKDDEL